MKTMTLAAAADYLGVTRQYVGTLVRDGVIRPVKTLGRRVHIQRVDVEAYKARRSGKCAHCGQLFTDSRRDRKFCSASCRQLSYHRGSKRKPPREGLRVIRDDVDGRLFEGPCIGCGATFQTKRPDGRYCGPTCAGRHYQRQRHGIKPENYKAHGQPRTKRNLERRWMED